MLWAGGQAGERVGGGSVNRQHVCSATGRRAAAAARVLVELARRSSPAAASALHPVDFVPGGSLVLSNPTKSNAASSFRSLSAERLETCRERVGGIVPIVPTDSVLCCRRRGAWPADAWLGCFIKGGGLDPVD